MTDHTADLGRDLEPQISEGLSVQAITKDLGRQDDCDSRGADGEVTAASTKLGPDVVE
jgi:hypothetical protein